MSELKPCPFCGGKSVSVGIGSTFRWRVAQCDDCGAAAGEVRCQTSGSSGSPAEWDAQAAKDAYAEWNRRV